MTRQPRPTTGLREGAPQLSRILSVCLCAIVAFVSTTGMTLLQPSPAIAASGTLTVETPLHQDPYHDSPMVALLSPGAVVTIDGPPVDGFYPVTAGDLTGWMRGETMSVAKDVPVEVVASYPPADTQDMAASTAQDAQDPNLSGPASSTPIDSTTDPAAAPPPADPAMGAPPPADGAPASDPAAAPPPPETATPPAGETTQEPAPGTTDPAAAGTTTPDPAQTGTAPPPPADATTMATEPVATASAPTDSPATEPPSPGPEMAPAATGGTGGTDAAPVASEPVSTPEPNVAPGPVAVTGPEGPATAAADVPIRVGPGTDFDRITLAPSGSTIYQTGHVIDGYVSVQFDGVTGWAALDDLASPGTESTPPPDATATESPVAGETLSADDSTPPSATEMSDGDSADRDKDKGEKENANNGNNQNDAANTPTPTPEPNPWGPASVLVNTPVYAGPSPDSGLIFTVPQGSTLEKTGEISHGYVSVRYKEVYGWAALDHLAEPIEFVEETLPEDSDDPVETKTPKPGSGVAYTTVDLSLRAGPSAEEEPIVVVPAGSRVELTGVMEGNFQRVTFGGEMGWISNDFLTNPKDPRPNHERKNKRKHYTEREIIKIINKAAKRHGQSKKDMVRVARCESNLDPYAVNPSGSYGLFQFIRSTWESTPYGDEDIFDPEANANAAGWMWAQGRKSEWVCQ